MSQNKRWKTEHAGAKNGGGAWATREEAKQLSNKIRRQSDKDAVDERKWPDDFRGFGTNVRPKNQK